MSQSSASPAAFSRDCRIRGHTREIFDAFAGPKVEHREIDAYAAHPETGMDYQIVAVTLRDGRVVEDDAVVHHSLVAEMRGHADILFDRAEITDIKVTHRKWDFR